MAQKQRTDDATQKKSYYQKRKAAKQANIGLAAFRASLQAKYKGAVVDSAELAQEEGGAYPTGILELDVALGTGGFPHGKIVEVYGPPSGGKTATMLIAAGEAQRRSGKAIMYVDVEGNLDRGFLEWAKKLGLDTSPERFLPVEPDTLEEAFEIIEQGLRQGMFAMIIVDSLAGLVPKTELEGDYGEQTLALRARALHAAIRKIRPVLVKSDCVFCFINQVITNPGQHFGNPEQTPGGKAIKFYAAQRLRVAAEYQSEEKERGQIMGHTVKVKVEKNKCAPPKREATFDLNYFTGVDRVRTLVRFGVELGVLVRKGTAIYYDGKLLGADKPAVTAAFEADPLFRDQLETKIRDMLLAKMRGADVQEELDEEQQDEALTAGDEEGGDDN